LLIARLLFPLFIFGGGWSPVRNCVIDLFRVGSFVSVSVMLSGVVRISRNARDGFPVRRVLPVFSELPATAATVFVALVPCGQLSQG
jgi:hypothetical protein